MHCGKCSGNPVETRQDRRPAGGQTVSTGVGPDRTKLIVGLSIAVVVLVVVVVVLL